MATTVEGVTTAAATLVLTEQLQCQAQMWSFPLFTLWSTVVLTVLHQVHCYQPALDPPWFLFRLRLGVRGVADDAGSNPPRWCKCQIVKPRK